MRILDLKLTYRCNNDCNYCCQERELRSQKSDLLLTDIEKILTEERNETIDKVILTGGEPTLNESLIEIVRQINKEGIKNIQLQTNAKKLMDKEYLQELINAGVNGFGISLHGHNAKIHEEFTGTKNSFDELINTLELIKETKVPVALNCVITKHNIEYLGELVEFIKENHYASSLQFAFIHITGKAEFGLNQYVKISEAAKKINMIIDKYGDKSIKITTEAIPCCLMYGHEKSISELYNDAEIITYDYRERREFTKARQNNFKTKGKLCNTCLFDSVCEGTWKEYPDIFGFDEFVPVKNFRGDYSAT